jgi:hypothetical protein
MESSRLVKKIEMESRKEALALVAMTVSLTPLDQLSAI